MIKFNSKLLTEDIKKRLPFLLAFGLGVAVFDFVFGKFCPMRIIFGLPCPSCGLTRAYLFVLSGNIREACRTHIFWIPLTILVVLYLMLRYFASSSIRQKADKILKILVCVLVVLAVIYYIYRMINYYPYVEPMVYDEENIIEMAKQAIRAIVS